MKKFEMLNSYEPANRYAKLKIYNLITQEVYSCFDELLESEFFKDRFYDVLNNNYSASEVIDLSPDERDRIFEDVVDTAITNLIEFQDMFIIKENKRIEKELNMKKFELINGYESSRRYEKLKIYVLNTDEVFDCFDEFFQSEFFKDFWSYDESETADSFSEEDVDEAIHDLTDCGEILIIKEFEGRWFSPLLF